MGFNDPTKPKILRTQLSEETHKKFKSMAASIGLSMANYVEKLVENEVEERTIFFTLEMSQDKLKKRIEKHFESVPMRAS